MVTMIPGRHIARVVLRRERTGGVSLASSGQPFPAGICKNCLFIRLRKPEERQETWG